jgi:hypothetical protein
MEEKNGSKVFLVSLVAGGMIVGLGSLGVVAFVGAGSVKDGGKENVSVSSEENINSGDVESVSGEEALGGGLESVVAPSSPTPSVGASPSVSPSPRIISSEEQAFKEAFFVSAQQMVEGIVDERVVATWDDGVTSFVHEFNPNGDIYFRVKSTSPLGEETSRELFCLGVEGSRECWTRNSMIVEGPQKWWRLDEPQFVALWEFPENRETNNFVDWFLARGLSSVNCTAAQAETVFDYEEAGGNNFSVVNTITARGKDGVEYLGDQEMTMVFGKNFESFRLYGSVKDVEDGVVRNTIEMTMRVADPVKDVFADKYPSLLERKDAVQAPALPLPSPSASVPSPSPSASAPGS